MDVVRLTRTLVDIPSPTGSEAEITSHLAGYLLGLGYSIDLQEVAPGRHNLFATAGGLARVVYTTHLDTVRPFAASHEDGEYVYGRGSCDAKGSIAAQIAAVERLRAAGASGLGFLFLVDEEVGSLGARLANEHARAAECEFLIGGEPTDNVVASASKGSLRFKLETRGTAAHSAYPERGASAIDALLAAIDRLRAEPLPTDAALGETTLNIGVLRGGTASNVVAAEAEAEIHVRLTTESRLVADAIERAVGDCAEIRYLSVTEPARFRVVDGFETAVVRFTTDLPHLSRWGTPLLVGPGSILDAHTSGERVAKRQLAEAATIYERIGARLLAVGERARPAREARA